MYPDSNMRKEAINKNSATINEKNDKVDKEIESENEQIIEILKDKEARNSNRVDLRDVENKLLGNDYEEEFEIGFAVSNDPDVDGIVFVENIPILVEAFVESDHGNTKNVSVDVRNISDEDSSEISTLKVDFGLIQEIG